MASIAADILGGGGGKLLEGVSKVIDSIKGKSPADAAHLAELTAKYQTDFLNAQLEQEKAELQAQVQQWQMQTEVNKVEAANPSVLVSGWRPFIGWVCGSGLAFQFVLGPILTWVTVLVHHNVNFPQLDLGTIVMLLSGMLGIGTLRTYEKVKGVSK